MEIMAVYDHFIKVAKFIIQNWDMILNTIVTILGALGVLVEGLNRLLPTKSGDSALTKLGKKIAIAGETVKAVMDKLKLPNVKDTKVEEPKES